MLLKVTVPDGKIRLISVHSIHSIDEEVIDGIKGSCIWCKDDSGSYWKVKETPDMIYAQQEYLLGLTE